MYALLRDKDQALRKHKEAWAVLGIRTEKGRTTSFYPFYFLVKTDLVGVYFGSLRLVLEESFSSSVVRLWQPSGRWATPAPWLPGPHDFFPLNLLDEKRLSG